MEINEADGDKNCTCSCGSLLSCSGIYEDGSKERFYTWLEPNGELTSRKLTEYECSLEDDVQKLQDALFSISSHYAKIQFRLSQIARSSGEERVCLLRELQKITCQGIDGTKDNDELPTLTSDAYSMGDVRLRQKRIITQLRSRLSDLSDFTESDFCAESDSSYNLRTFDKAEAAALSKVYPEGYGKHDKFCACILCREHRELCKARASRRGYLSETWPQMEYNDCDCSKKPTGKKRRKKRKTKKSLNVYSPKSLRRICPYRYYGVPFYTHNDCAPRIPQSTGSSCPRNQAELIAKRRRLTQGSFGSSSSVLRCACLRNKPTTPKKRSRESCPCLVNKYAKPESGASRSRLSSVQLSRNPRKSDGRSVSSRYSSSSFTARKRGTDSILSVPSNPCSRIIVKRATINEVINCNRSDSRTGQSDSCADDMEIDDRSDNGGYRSDLPRRRRDKQSILRQSSEFPQEYEGNEEDNENLRSQGWQPPLKYSPSTQGMCKDNCDGKCSIGGHCAKIKNCFKKFANKQSKMGLSLLQRAMMGYNQASPNLKNDDRNQLENWRQKVAREQSEKTRRRESPGVGKKIRTIAEAPEEFLQSQRPIKRLSKLSDSSRRSSSARSSQGDYDYDRKRTSRPSKNLPKEDHVKRKSSGTSYRRVSAKSETRAESPQSQQTVKNIVKNNPDRNQRSSSVDKTERRSILKVSREETQRDRSSSNRNIPKEASDRSSKSVKNKTKRRTIRISTKEEYEDDHKERRKSSKNMPQEESANDKKGKNKPNRYLPKEEFAEGSKGKKKRNTNLPQEEFAEDSTGKNKPSKYLPQNVTQYEDLEAMKNDLNGPKSSNTSQDKFYDMKYETQRNSKASMKDSKSGSFLENLNVDGASKDDGTKYRIGMISQKPSETSLEEFKEKCRLDEQNIGGLSKSDCVKYLCGILSKKNSKLSREEPRSCREEYNAVGACRDDCIKYRSDKINQIASKLGIETSKSRSCLEEFKPAGTPKEDSKKYRSGKISQIASKLGMEEFKTKSRSCLEEFKATGKCKDDCIKFQCGLNDEIPIKTSNEDSKPRSGLISQKSSKFVIEESKSGVISEKSSKLVMEDPTPRTCLEEFKATGSCRTDCKNYKSKSISQKPSKTVIEDTKSRSGLVSEKPSKLDIEESKARTCLEELIAVGACKENCKKFKNKSLSQNEDTKPRTCFEEFKALGICKEYCKKYRHKTTNQKNSKLLIEESKPRSGKLSQKSSKSSVADSKSKSSLKESNSARSSKADNTKSRSGILSKNSSSYTPQNSSKTSIQEKKSRKEFSSLDSRRVKYQSRMPSKKSSKLRYPEESQYEDHGASKKKMRKEAKGILKGSSNNSSAGTSRIDCVKQRSRLRAPSPYSTQSMVEMTTNIERDNTNRTFKHKLICDPRTCDRYYVNSSNNLSCPNAREDKKTDKKILCFSPDASVNTINTIDWPYKKPEEMTEQTITCYCPKTIGSSTSKPQSSCCSWPKKRSVDSKCFCIKPSFASYQVLRPFPNHSMLDLPLVYPHAIGKPKTIKCCDRKTCRNKQNRMSNNNLINQKSSDIQTSYHMENEQQNRY